MNRIVIKNTHRALVFVSLHLLVFHFTKAQTAPQVIEPSINAKQFINISTSTEDLHTGQVSISIPLFDIAEKGIQVPVSLYFNGANVGYSTESSNIGLGWSLLAGGVLTRTIRDRVDSSSDSKEWMYNGNYVTDQRMKERYNKRHANSFDEAMSLVLSYDKEPDEFSYSFNGYSGDIAFKFDATNTYKGTLYPHITFKIEKTNDGYTITTDKGLKYYFENKEATNNEGDVTSWFLTKITSPQGGEISFEYENDQYENLLSSRHPNAIYHSKRIVKINFASGYILFHSDSRTDMAHPYDSRKLSRKISSIELYDNENKLIKGFELDNNDYFLSERRTVSKSHRDKRLKLNGLKQYNKNKHYLPPYVFDYDSKFTIDKSGVGHSNGFTYVHNSWASTPSMIHFGDRRMDGDYEPILWEQDSISGYTPTDRKSSFGFDSSFLLLSKIQFPSGGHETFKYENHDYDTYGPKKDGNNGYSNSPKIKGKRIAKKEIVDGLGNTTEIAYVYCMHDTNYQRLDNNSYITPRLISSGVLVNPSIRFSAMYKPIFNDRSFPLVTYPNNPVPTRLVGSLHKTEMTPQNKLRGSPIYYREVEEVYKTSSEDENGKNIYYFKEEVAVPAKNYIYLNYNQNGRANSLIEIPNNLYGTYDPGGYFNSFVFMAFPIGDFFEYPYYRGKVLKQVTLNSDGDIVKKIEHKYSSPYTEKLYGLIVHKFVDDPSDVNVFTDNDYGIYGSLNRYLISRYIKPFGYLHLDEKKVTNYFPKEDTELTEIVTYTYTNENLVRSSKTENSDQKTKIDYYYYPNDTFYSGNNLVALKTKNIIGKPIDVRTYNDAQLISGSQTKYNTNGQPTDNYIAEPNGTNIPFSASSIYTFTHKTSYSYNNSMMTQISLKDGPHTVYLYGYTHQYPIAKIENATFSEVARALGVSEAALEGFNENQLGKINGLRAKKPEWMITTFTHIPLVGVKTITDPKGLTTTYEYDDFNRLELIKNHNGDILEAYEYNYRTE